MTVEDNIYIPSGIIIVFVGRQKKKAKVTSKGEELKGSYSSQRQNEPKNRDSFASSIHYKCLNS
ncbi:hypothetical protein SDJN02_23251, partial [Cucurbita argyrosperma subsp. argyrosperma]